MSKKFFTRITLVLILFLSFAAFNVQGQAVVTTDQPDYLPGTTVTIGGSGFQPGENVKLQVLHNPTGGDDSTSAAHQPWTVIADSSGNIYATWDVPPNQDEAGANLILTSDGESSLLHSEVLFTDAAFSSVATGNWDNRNTWGAVARTGQINAATNSTSITGAGTAFLTELVVGDIIYRSDGTTIIGTVASISSNTSLTLTANATNNDGNNAGSAAFSAKKIPGAGDAVTIASGNTVTVTTNASCTSLSFLQTSTVNSQLSINSGITLAVSGAVTIPRQSISNTLAVGAGILNAGSIAFTSGGTTARHFLTISTGTVNVTGNIDATGSSGSATIQMTGAGTINVGGTFLGGGTGTFTPSTGTVNFNGSTSAQTIPVSTYNFNNVQINNTNANGAALDGPSTAADILGNISVQSGMFDNGGFAITLASGKNFSVSNGANFTLNGTTSMVSVSGGGTKTFGATSTVEYGGAAQTVTVEGYGNLALSGSGTKTFSGATTIAGNLSISPTAVARLLAGSTSTAATLTLAGSGATSGSWGSTSSAATNKNNTYFGPTTGILNVTTNTCTTPTITTTGSLTGCTGTTTTSLAYSATANSPTSYSIDWDAAANGDGLLDQGKTTFTFATGSGTINNIAITAGTPDGIYNGTMTITSEGGCSSTKAITLVLNATPTSVNGTQTICSPATLNFDLSTLITNSITSNYQWSAVTNGSVSGEGSGTTPFITNTLTLTGGATTTTVLYNVTPTSTTGACAGSPFTVSVTVNGTPATPATITGPTPVCPNIGNITYTVASVTGATDYAWTVPTGWLITAGQGTTSISVTSGDLLQNGNISVTASNTCGTSSARTLAVTIFDANNIGFNNVVTNNSLTVCAGTSGIIVGGNPTNGQTYQWQVSNTSSAGPYSIVSPDPGSVQNWTITANYYNTPGTYYFRRVISGNDNCNGESDVVTFVVNPLPVVAALTGTQTICIGATTTYASTTAGGVWSSDNTARATVVNGVVTGVSAGTANISYAVTNEFGCVTTVSRSVTIIAPPAATPTISGSISVCSVDNTLSYSISTVSNATYVWTVPTGWVITSGQNTNSINVTSGTTGQSGNITVAVSNACGSGLGTLAVGFLDDIGYGGVPTANSSTTCRGIAPSQAIIGGAAPSGPFYQWQVSSNGAGFVNIFGATAQNYTISSTYYNVAGTHIFHRVISSSTNACNGTSDDVTLIVNTPPLITTSPSAVTLTYGSSASFSSVVAPGSGAVTYQWQENAGSGFVNINDGGIYSNATTATLSISQPSVAMNGYKYQVVVTGGCSPAATSASATLTVNKRAVTVTADAGQTKVYGDVDPLSFGYHISSGTLAFVTDGFSGALSRVAGESAGLYAITLGNLTLGNNYNLGFVPANFSITQLPVTITADAQNKTYGDVDPALTFTSNPAVGDALANGLSIAFTGSLTRAAGESVGSYAINQGTVDNANYDITYNGANLKIDPLAVTVTAVAKNKTYGDVDPALTFTSSPAVGSALANGISIAFTGSLTRAAGETVGSYAINQGSVNNANYDITYNGADLKIDPLAVTVTADAESKTYGDVDPALTFVSVPAVGHVLANGDHISFSGELSRAAGETVGSYAIKQGTVDNANYDISYNGANLKINQLAVTVTANPESKTYGAVDPALTFVSVPAVGHVLANGDQISFSGELSRAAGETVGSYAINQGTVDNANYDITYNGANLKINPLAVTVTADAKGKIYGDVDPALTFTSSPAVGSALAIGDLISFSGELSRDPGETVGSYAIKQGTVDNANYDISYNGANLKIDPLAVTVTPDANSKIYGDVDPALTGTLTGFLPADNVTASYSRAPGETVAGGPYTISATLSPANVLGNYDITYNTANFTIGKATSTTVVTIAAGPFTYTSSAITPASVIVTGAGGLSLTPAPVYSNNINAGTAVASYTFAGDANHFGSDDTKSFTIDKAPLSVTANSKAKYSGQVNPSLDGTLTGVLGSDGITATYSTIATQASCAGSYPIVPALVDPNGKLGNYAVTATNGTLVVTGNTVDLFDLSPVPFNTSITLYALVKPAAAGIPVDFYIDANPIKVGTGITDALGKASYTISAGKPEDVYGVVASIGSCISSTSGFLPVYDPTKGFACGNGSILSPIGAYPANALNIAKGRFGFSVKYKKGSTLPQGELDFQLKKNKFKLESTSFQWLVIAGNKAQFSGTGKINGTGTYNFTVTAIDNSPCEIDDEHDGDCDDDRDHHEGFDLDENHAGYHRDGKKCNDRKCLTPDQFRIKITTTAGVVIYDNQMGMPVDGYAASDITRGAIEVNDLKATKRSTGANVIAATPAVTNLSLAVTSLEVNVMPNPTTNYFNVVIKGKDASPVTVRVMNIYGKVILNQKVASAATLHMGDNWTNGTYLIEVIQGNEKKVMRAIKAN